ncbi:MAG: DUF2993 domain-containing protein [Actinomycetota bacterium]|nr:DUF2993 domain-containing protein [Actinomycetota bacterium]
MRKLLGFVVFLALVLGAADIASRIAIQRQLEQRVNSYVPSGAAKVTIHSFPFLPKVAANGRIDRITAHARQVSQGEFVLDQVDITMTGVRIHRSRLLRERKLEIVAIETGTVTTDMTQADLGRLVGVPVTLGAGSARVTVAGVSVTGRISISNGRLRLESAGLPVTVPIPTLPVLPCLAEVRIIPGHLVASCTFHQIPAALRLALQ